MLELSFSPVRYDIRQVIVTSSHCCGTIWLCSPRAHWQIGFRVCKQVCSGALLIYWTGKNSVQNRRVHFRCVNEETALRQNNRRIVQTTTKYYIQRKHIKPLERDTRFSLGKLDWLCYSRTRNSEKLRFFQKSSAGTESSPIAFVKKGLFHRRTPGSEIAWAQARSSISESHWLVLTSGDVITQRILTVTKQTRLIYRMLKGRKAYVPGKRTIVVCKSARWRQKTLTKVR